MVQYISIHAPAFLALMLDFLDFASLLGFWHILLSFLHGTFVCSSGHLVR
tara:strand:- start:215 stop:364 length:150 start_codon:yes stop_codon:yes gene_type:complete